MLLIVMHNNEEYLQTVMSMLRREGVIDTTVIKQRKIVASLMGEGYTMLSSVGTPREEYDKVLISVIPSGKKVQHILDMIESNPQISRLNLCDKGFISTIPFERIVDLALEAGRIQREIRGVNIADLLRPDLICLDLKARTKEEVIRELAGLLVHSDRVLDLKKYVEDVLEREAACTTGIGNGIAIPHARTDAVSGLVIAFGRSSTGVDFASLDKKPSKLIFLIGTSKLDVSTYLKFLAHLTRLLKKEPLRQALMSALDGASLIQSFREVEH